MDIDRLQRITGIIKKCIQYQEVTETSELMDPAKITLNVHYDSAGEHNPNPNVAQRSYTGFLAATQALRDGQSLHYPAIPIITKVPSTASTVATANSTKTPAAPAAPSPPSSPLQQSSSISVDLYAPCERIRGLVPVSEHTFGIYKWLQRGRDIAEPKTHAEVRRPRKEATSSASSAVFGRRGVANNNGAATSPRSTAGTSSLSEEQGDDRQFLSVIVVLYGRVNFLIQDEMYFTEAGKLVIIDRFLVQPVDPTSVKYQHDKASLFKLGRSVIDRSIEKHAVIDFSFKDLKDPIDALRVTPITGDAHQARPIFRPPTQDRVPEAVTFGNNEAASQGTRKLIVAKNRKGEEEAYEFEIKAVIRAETEEKKSDDDVRMQQLASKLASKYDGEVVRMCNNNLVSASNLVPVLRNLVANHFLTIQWIDLSNNMLTTVPDLSSLPLKTLYLHANNISDWQEIEEHVCVLPQLTSVTCHGNPIATKDKDYKQQLLMRIQRAKALMKGSAPIKLVDFVAVSACDTHVATMFSHFTLGGTIPLAVQNSTGGGGTSPRTPRKGGDSFAASFQTNSPRSTQRTTSPRR